MISRPQDGRLCFRNGRREAGQGHREPSRDGCAARAKPDAVRTGRLAPSFAVAVRLDV